MQNPTGLTDISNLPADRVKPQEGKFEQSTSQSSTMQSVDHENIREQMPQGSLEHLNAETGLIAQGVEATKEFAHKAAEKIEEFVTAAVEKIQGLGKGSAPADKKEELKEGVAKRAYLVRKSASRKLGKRSEKIQKEAGLVAGIAKVYGKEEYKNLRRKANRYGKQINRDAGYFKNALKGQGKQLEGKASRFQQDFSRDGSLFGAQLREGARSLRSQARTLLNGLAEQAELTKKNLKSELQGKPAPSFSGASDASPSKFLLEFSSNDMNGRSGQFRAPAKRYAFDQEFQGKPASWSMDISAHDWNESVSTMNRYIGFLMDKANDFSKRASKQGRYAQRRLNRERRNFKRQAEGILEKGKQSL